MMAESSRLFKDSMWLVIWWKKRERLFIYFLFFIFFIENVLDLNFKTQVFIIVKIE